MSAFLRYIYDMLAIVVFAVPFLGCLSAIVAQPVAVVVGVSYLSTALYQETFRPKIQDWGPLFGIGICIGGILAMGSIFETGDKTSKIWPKVASGDGEGEERDAELGPFGTGLVMIEAAWYTIWEFAIFVAAVAVVLAVIILVVFGIIRLIQAVQVCRQRRGKTVPAEETELEEGVGSP